MEHIKRSFWQVAKRFFEPVRKDYRPWARASVAYTLWTIGLLVTISFLKYITQAIEQGDTRSFFSLVAWFGGFVVVYQTIKLCLRNRGWVELTTKTIKLIYTDYIKDFIKLDNTSIEKLGTGRLISIIDRGFTTWNDLLVQVFWLGNRIVLSFIFFGFIIWQANGRLFAAFLISFIALHVLLNYLNLRILANKRLCNPIRNEYMRNMVKIIMSKFEIMVQKRQHDEINKLDKITEDLYTLTRKRSAEIQLLYAIPETFISVLRIIMFLIVGIGILHHTYTFSDLVVFSTTLGLMDRVLDLSSSTVKDFFARFSDIEQLWNTFDTIPTVTGYDTGDPFTFQQGNIVLEKITFAYTATPIFHDFSLTIAGGMKTAFVGESGGGKTLIKLLAGYIKADAGDVVVDGQAFSKIKLNDYYSHIGYLTQEPSVFDGTIYENLMYALHTEPSQEVLEKVITQARCEFIWEFDKGLHTEIGERGIRLSGGQKQRLAIAKIMLKNPNIILLDEPTSALDSFNEEQISIALHNLFKGKTVIVVAHRLQTVKQADRILLIEEGKILEDGTHEQLVKLNGKYKKMLDLQSGF